MTVLCLGYRPGFDEAAAVLGLEIHYVVEKVKPELESLGYTKVTALADTEQVLRALHGRLDGVTGVVTGHEQAVFTAAFLRGSRGLPGEADALRTLRFRDKSIQKASLPSDVARASCAYVPRDPPAYLELADRLGERFVVKPADGYGSQATALVTDQTGWDDYLTRHPVDSDVQTVVESYVAGSEIHVDGIWRGNRLLWCAVTPYLGHLMDWDAGALVGDVTLGTAEPDLRRRATALTHQVLTALETPDTVFHLEAYVSPDGSLTFGEVAARLAGGLTTEVLAYTYGVDLYRSALELAVGRELVVAPRADPERLYGYSFLSWRSDRELTKDDFTSRFDLVECDYPPRDVGRTGMYGHWGYAIVAAPTPEELTQRLHAVVEFNRRG